MEVMMFQVMTHWCHLVIVVKWAILFLIVIRFQVSKTRNNFFSGVLCSWLCGIQFEILQKHSLSTKCSILNMLLIC